MLVYPSGRRAARAFTLCELAACIATLVVAICLADAAGRRSRTLARCGEDLSHLRTIYAGHQSYAADFKDRVCHFSWPGYIYWLPSNYPDLQHASDPLMAHRFQMVDIIRRHGRTEMPNMASVNLFPNFYYGHLVLLDYLGLDPPTRLFVAAGDRRAQWADDPLGYDAGLYTPDFGHSQSPADSWRHPYGSSFVTSLDFIDGSPPNVHPNPGTYTNVVILYVGQNGSVFRGNLWSRAAFPSQKAFVFDQVARYFGTPVWHMDAGAKFPVLMADGTASVRAAVEANAGAHPNYPADPGFQQIYQPTVVQPPAADPPQRYWLGVLWTRMGLAGRDFGGPDVYPAP
jgi:hypothetical protein